ncbi:uncharacterized protein SPSK_09231 [Sporothrix schenckii 1099-18]|uniref:LYC1 C-terminal domain-containing protein n=2 Tax=Sporothrix schenckii TaxID=29908 RepID=U7Q5M5_SPOS1|nr:uncharacterized protein SPSK_09231 [Sporothrix schenckii 1099-18]ERT03194.1 hypothetical protein HMPREF1624_01499 [Sporothrix schenckii ATCC 58251]KJR84385.1 hypothetical protein SPSK_09231 [Sporothrix schenckii 1099-18]
MGSTGHDESLPEATDPALVLALPTAQERRKVWELTHTMWGNALLLDDYLKREEYLTTVPLAMESGITHWILTDSRRPVNDRPILSSCETLRKHAMSAEASTTATVVDGIAHGIASVFTDPAYRGKGYAGRMLEELGHRLEQWQVTSPAHEEVGANMMATKTDSEGNGKGNAPKTLFSVLYSDIGKTFYASKGWPAFPSTHLSFPPLALPLSETEDGAASYTSKAVHSEDGSFTVTPLGYHELTELCPIDVQLLRARLIRRATRRAVLGGGSGRPSLAGPSVTLVPDLNTMLWHLMREDYMTKHIFSKTPTVRGALCTLNNAPQPGGSGVVVEKQRSIWVIWTRGYYSGLKTLNGEGNTLYILHVVLEDLDDDFPADPGEVPISQQHVDGFAAIVRMAQGEAAAWRCGEVQLWNPTPAQRILAERSGIAYKEVLRDKDSIPSLRWHGKGVSEDVDWVANEKFGWY